MAVIKTRMSYLAATYAGDHLWVGDWLTHNDQRLRATRKFQIIREADQLCVMRAEIDYVCINISSGRPRRMPKDFAAAFVAVPTSSPQ